MEKDSLYNQVNPLVRVKEGELLTKAQWEQIENASSLDALRAILSSTFYADLVKEKDYADYFMDGLEDKRSDFFSWAYEVAPEKELVDIYTLRYTFHNLKALTKGQLTGRNLDYLYVPDGRIEMSVMKSAIASQKSSLLPDYLMEGILEVLDYFEKGNILQGIDIIYDRLYLTRIKLLAVKLGYPELLENVEGFIDLSNIGIMNRGILQKQTKTFLSTVLSSSGSIEKNAFLNYAGTSQKEFTEFVLNTKYHYLLAPLVKENHLDIPQFAVLKDNYLTDFYSRSKTVAFGPLPLLALINAKEVEEKNLRLFVAGLNNGFSKELLKGRMRKISGL